MASKTATPRESIGRVGQRRQVVIPREFLEQLQMNVGDTVSITRTKNSVVIEPRRVVDTDDKLTPEEAKTVRRGEAQLRRGDAKAWRDIKHAMAR
jgi:bifunctional DNA-binding transcriptional regulator/antitoxin component of YhaV-PrlF toxin-antitoxin module